MTQEQIKTVQENCVTEKANDSGEKTEWVATYGDFEGWGDTKEESVANLILSMEYVELSWR